MGLRHAATVQQYLHAGLIDELHLAIVPMLLGGGARLFDQLDSIADRYAVVEVVGSPAVHVRITRTPP